MQESCDEGVELGTYRADTTGDNAVEREGVGDPMRHAAIAGGDGIIDGLLLL
jgi:hypothetical protein